MNKVKETSFDYGTDYQNNQVEKYLNRANNHWQKRVDVFNLLLDKIIAQNFPSTKNEEIRLSDIGCSIGTFAIEGAKKGFNACGIDFDKSAIEIAKQLAKKEGVKAEFFCGDIAAANLQFGKTDIAVCFDIFEHLHDDELGAFLLSIKNNLSEKGGLIFHTFPTEYDYLFFQNKWIHLPLILFSIFPTAFFDRIVKIYASKINALLLLFKGISYKEYIKNLPHCNPLSRERLEDILKRAGYHIDFLETAQLFDYQKKKQNLYKKHTISHRNLYGIAYPKKENG